MFETPSFRSRVPNRDITTSATTWDTLHPPVFIDDHWYGWTRQSWWKPSKLIRVCCPMNRRTQRLIFKRDG